MATTAETHRSWELFRDSGEPRVRPSARTDVVMTAVSLWFVLGLFLDAYAHANLPELETFFTPWHAVFYSGFAATAGWVLWTVWRQVRAGRRGIAAVPVGYGLAVVALPVFVVSATIDLLWHTLIGIESTTDIFFSPSHLGLVTSMILILTSPLRAAWSDPAQPARPSLRAVLPAVLTLAFAATLVLLFLTYASALVYGSRGVVQGFSVIDDGEADQLAARMVVTTLVLLGPLLLLAKRWELPRGSAVVVFATAALISSMLTGFDNLEIQLALLVAALLVEVLAAWLRPAAQRRAAFWGFAAAAPFVTWAVYLGAASLAEGTLPAVPEFWTGAPIIMGLVGWLLAALMLPSAERVPVVNS